MRRLSFFLLFFLMGMSAVTSQTNEGKRFWCGFMEHRDIGQNTMVAMITSKVNTTATISIPLQGWSQNITIAANNVTLVQLPKAAETLGSEQVTQTGILITSAEPVSVYLHQYFRARSEAAVVLPVESIGKEYFVMTYRGVLNNGTIYPSEFLIVANEDDTQIQIDLADRTRAGRSQGSSFTVTLNAGQTFQVQAAEAAGDLSGSRLRGNKNFTLMAGNRWTEVPNGCGARDNILEQMPSVDVLGKKFVTVPNAGSNYDVFRVMAVEDGTVVEVQDQTPVTYNLNTGQYVEYQQSEPSFIQSNKGILVGQFNVGNDCSGHSVGDPSMVILNSIEQTRDTVTLYNSSLENIVENYINIIAQTADTGSIYLDGRKIIDQNLKFTTVGVNANFAFVRVRVNTGSHTIASTGCGVIATAYGYGSYESYAYAGGASFSKINASPIPEGACLNDTTLFDTKLPVPRYSFEWDLGDGTKTTQSSFTHVYKRLGNYPVQVIVKDRCLNTIDTVRKNLLVTLRQAVQTVPEIIVCDGDDIQLQATDLPEARYEWTGPGGYVATEQFPEIMKAKTTQSGKYGVIGIVSGCATFPAFTQVLVSAIPQPLLGRDTIVCTEKEDFRMVLSPGKFDRYEWQDGSTSPVFDVTEAGKHWVSVTTVYGCTNSDTILLASQCPTKLYAPTAFSPNGDGQNDSFSLLGKDITSLKLTIYDRWGTQVFVGKTLENAWNGNIKGLEAPAGVYVWVADVRGFNRKGEAYTFRESGEVLLIR